ncbi:MAG: recombinase family protein [Oscillospiraceae bacterium]
MNIAAYCRVSTDKADQLNSLEAQKEFFSEYTKRTGTSWCGSMPTRVFPAPKSKTARNFSG